MSDHANRVPPPSLFLLALALVLIPAAAASLHAEPLRVKDDQGREVTFPEGKASFADAVVARETTSSRPAKRASDPQKTLGPPDYRGDRSPTFLSLGAGGSVTLRFDDNVLIDVPGPDLYVFEVGNAELVRLEISEDGSTWIDIGRLEGGVSSVDIAGRGEEGAQYRYVRLTDLQLEAKQPFPGADIDAVGAIGAAERVDLPAAVLFDVDSHVLKPGASSVLDELVSRITARTDAVVTVHGHTDASGSDEHNLDLSLRRANEVADYLADHGVSKDRLTTRGWGESRPTASNDTDEGRQQNRRVEVVIRTQ